MFRYAVRRGAREVNPVREVELPQNLEAKGRTGGARDITVDELRFILTAVRARKLTKKERERAKPLEAYTPPTVADYCAGADLADWVTLLAATGLRRSQVLALLWSDIDLNDKTLRTTGKVVHVAGQGLARIVREADPKNRKGRIALPEFAVVILTKRKQVLAERKRTRPPAEPAEYDLVFPPRDGR
ncbi:hypothetical protein [Nocardia sp. NPDC059239]|uniref:hypothetical protein n=1 Tax=unclassified Nocardia TaxID=2637762 RepID=UPI00368517FD